MPGRLIQITLGKANPERANGVNVAVHGLSVALQASGADVEVWGLTPTPADPTSERPYRLRLFQRRFNRLGLDAELLAALWDLPLTSLVHFHGGLILEYYHVARVLKRRGIPWVITLHGAYVPAALKRGRLKKRLFTFFFDGFVLGQAARVHGLAPISLAGLPARIPASKCVVIPNGFSAPVEPLATLDTDPFRFAFCGRLDQHTKGLDLLIEALGLAPKAGLAIELDLIGAGPDRQALQQRIEALGLSAEVRLLGELFGAEKRAALLHSNGFILTSRHEGFPMSVLEACSLGLPVVVSEGTNFGDSVRRWDCGAIAAAATPEAIFEAIQSIAMSSPERLAEMSSNALRLVREEFLWERIAKRLWDELYAPSWEWRD